MISHDPEHGIYLLAGDRFSYALAVDDHPDPACGPVRHLHWGKYPRIPNETTFHVKRRVGTPSKASLECGNVECYSAMMIKSVRIADAADPAVVVCAGE